MANPGARSYHNDGLNQNIGTKGERTIVASLPEKQRSNEPCA